MWLSLMPKRAEAGWVFSTIKTDPRVLHQALTA
jgi:hypothetical protein